MPFRRFLLTAAYQRAKAASEESRVKASFRARYTTTKRVDFKAVVESSHGVDEREDDTNGRAVRVEVLFTGPQPSGGPGSMLCNLLSGSSVEAQPVNLCRGRKKKKYATETATRTDAIDLGEPLL